MVGLWSRAIALKEMKLIQASARGARECAFEDCAASTQDRRRIPFGPMPSAVGGSAGVGCISDSMRSFLASGSNDMA